MSNLDSPNDDCVCVCRFRNDQNYSLVCSKFSSFLINVFILLCSHSPTHTRQSNSIYFTMCLVDIVYGRRTVSNRYSEMLIYINIYIICYYDKCVNKIKSSSIAKTQPTQSHFGLLMADSRISTRKDVLVCLFYNLLNEQYSQTMIHRL